MSGRLKTVVPGRRVFDHATVELQLTGEVPGRLWASMAAAGHNHGLRIRVFGTQGNLEWQHEDPHHLTVQDLDGTTTVLTEGLSTLSEDASRLTRVGLGHPEGFLEAFANFYLDLADGTARPPGRHHAGDDRELSIPTGHDGLVGVQFVEAVAASNARDAAWVSRRVPAEKAGSDHAALRTPRRRASSAPFTPPTSQPTRTLTSRWSTTSTRTRAKALAVQHGARAAADLEEVFDSAAVDAVFIASSTDTHADHLRRAAGAGSRCCAKSQSTWTSGGPSKLRRLRRPARVTAMVDFNRRFDRDYAELKRVVDCRGDRKGGAHPAHQPRSGHAAALLHRTSPAARCATRPFTSSTWSAGSRSGPR